MLHSILLGRASVTSLSGYLDTIFAITSDMGIEFGIADFRAEDATRLVPHWFLAAGETTDMADAQCTVAPAAAASDVEECDMQSTGDPADADAAVAAAQNFVFEVCTRYSRIAAHISQFAGRDAHSVSGMGGLMDRPEELRGTLVQEVPPR